VQTDVKKSQVLITGDLVTNVGTATLFSSRVIYQIHYRYDAGRLLVSRFQEVKKID
jgi:hypothetical protein